MKILTPPLPLPYEGRGVATLRYAQQFPTYGLQAHRTGGEGDKKQAPNGLSVAGDSIHY